MKMTSIQAKVAWVVAIVGVIAGACAPAAPPTPTVVAPSPIAVSPTPSVAAAAATPVPSPAGKPRYGGTLRVSATEGAPEFDLAQTELGGSLRSAGPAYNGLVELDPANPEKLVPGLSERWEVSGDGKTYTFHLRKGVKFHDGQPFTSADAKASFQRVIWPPKGMVSKWQSFFQTVSQVEIVDEYTVRFVLESPQASLLDMMALPAGLIYPKHVLDAKGDMKKQVVGTGPFRLASYETGVGWESEKNHDYWRMDRPYLDKVRGLFIPDPSVVAAALRTGSVDIMQAYVLPGAGTRSTMLKAGLKVRDVLGGINLFSMNVKRKPWSDVRIRRAVSLATARDAGVTIIHQSDAVIGGPMAPGPWAIPEEELLKLPGYRLPKDQDVAEGKRLLAEAGYPKGFKTTILARTTSTNPATAVFMADQLWALGIDAKLQIKESAVVSKQLNVNDFDTTANKLTPPVHEPDAVFGYYWTTKAGANFVGYSNPKLDELFEKQSRSVDPAERKRILLEMQHIVLEDSPGVVLSWTRDPVYYSPRVRGFVPLSLKQQERYEAIWLASAE